jgi:poly-gamma-glutamate capsule biosynthesis protein CapA/YwtB (metallophosphatase superfamily)
MREILLNAVGDVVAYHHEPARAFGLVIDDLRDADLVFAQVERHLSDRTFGATGDMVEVAPVAHGESLRSAGIDIASFASNHAMDFGPEPMLATAGHLRDLGMEVIGMGEDEAQARRPAVVERDGVRVGFLAYCSVLKPGEAATATKAGVAPMRAYTHYHQVDYQPGTPPEILTFPHAEDLDAAVADVQALREQVDVVVVSLHWGVHFTPALIAGYQREVAHRLIDAGTDVILGHHPHELKAIEVYRKRAIFYSLGNFAFDQPQEVIREAARHSPFVAKKTRDWGFEMDDPQWADYSFPPDSRYSMIARIRITQDGVRPSFLPVRINGRAQPEVVRPQDPRFDEFIAYMDRISASQGIGTRYLRRGSEIEVGSTDG